MSTSQKINILMTEGLSTPLGITSIDENSVNCAVYAPDAARLFVLFYLPDTEEFIEKVELTNRTGNVFHGHISGINPDWLYALQTTQLDKNKGKQVDDKILLDPYAKGVNRPLVWNYESYKEQSQFFMPKSRLTNEPFDWQGVTKPNIPRSKTILYETHVKGYTQLCEQLPKDKRGKYLGLAEPNVLKYLTDLGVTSVQLMPVFCFMSEPRLQELGLTNYWGYNPINFFSPDPRYAQADPVNEFKTLVREFHRHGLEVILDVVYNHTAEGGPDGPVLSFRGLAEFDFYLKTDDSYSFNYANYTGCGNTVNCDSDYVLRMIMDSLRYWLEEMQVDGFRFDLGATLGRNGDRFNRKAALFRAMAQDPIVSQAKLIAEPWDIGPEGYQVGNFPAYWLECNDKYRDGLRRFWRGEKGLVADIASRILGSRDVFVKGKRSQVSSVNYIAYHDGFTLHDIVSYENRHNLANLEDNRDGHGANFSRNYGVEGPTTRMDVVELREKQKRNMIASLLFSQGVPHILAGDEFSRTQNGNNNAYCQDNEISWVNWHLDQRQRSFKEFVQRCIKLRKEYEVLQQCFLPDDNYQHSDYHHHVNWIRPDGETKRIEDWHNHDAQCLGLIIADDDKGYQMVLILNTSDHDVLYVLPEGNNKKLLLDTSVPDLVNGKYKFTRAYMQSSRSLSLWKIDYSN